MNFDFATEQHALRDQARRLFGDGVRRARQLLDRGESCDPALWTQIVSLGFTAAAVPEDLGGLGLGALELCVMAEEAGRTLAPVPLASSVFHATEALRLAGGELARAWLPRLASGEVTATVAFVETAGTWDAPPESVVVGGKLSGSKGYVAHGVVADAAVVSARSEEDGDGFGWWLVDLRGDGVRREAFDGIDPLRGYARLLFDGAPAARIGSAGDGARLATRMLDVAAVLDAFEQLGGAQALLHTCIDYAKTRRAFGSVIGVNQAVKHRLADMYTRIELARGHCLYGAWALSSTSSDVPVAAAGARLAATDAFSFAAEEAIELHGGIGFTWESDCHLYYRRARSLSLALGNRQRWCDRLVDALAARRSSN